MEIINFYVLVDTLKKEVIDKLQVLPENWNNISGLNVLSDEKLKSLEWAGHPNLGWINLHSQDIRHYKCSPDNLQLQKNEIKFLISKLRKEKQKEPIVYKNFKIKSDIKTKIALFSLKDCDRVNFKCIDKYASFDKIDIQNIYKEIQNQYQKYFDIESKLYEKIDQCKNLSDFLNINFYI